MSKFLSAVVILAGTIVVPVSASAATYKVDPEHTKIEFKVRHLGISYVIGHFSTLDATFSFDPNNVPASKAMAKISAKTVNTDNQKRDDHLRSPEFLDAQKFPDINFVSKGITGVRGKTFKVSGDLTIHGVTRPVTLDTEFGGEMKDPWGNERAAFSATGKINRKDFGLAWNKILETGGLLVGEDVIIVLEVEGIKEKTP